MAIAKDKKRNQIAMYKNVWDMLEQLSKEQNMTKSEYLQELIVGQWDDRYGLLAQHREDIS